MKRVLKAIEEVYRAAGNIHPVSSHVADGDRVWKLALECGHVLVTKRAYVFKAPEMVTCKTCLKGPEPAGRDLRQAQVTAWCLEAFGETHTTSVHQRAIRLLEEAIEAYQAAGGEYGMAYQLVDYVFARPKGELGQELGGVGVTVLALASAAGLSADAEEAKEVARVLAIDVEVVRKRNAAKDAAGFTVARGDGK